MNGDAGAAEIRRLLTARNPALERAIRNLATELPHGVSLRAQPTLRIVVEPGLVEAIEQLRRVYRSLRRRIDAIDTERRVAKRRVLDAIDLLNTSFTLLLRSTEATSYASGLRSIGDAKTRQARSASELKRALEELA